MKPLFQSVCSQNLFPMDDCVLHTPIYIGDDVYVEGVSVIETFLNWLRAGWGEEGVSAAGFSVFRVGENFHIPSALKCHKEVPK